MCFLPGNSFLDYDLSREHTRMGLGLEYGRDYLKLSANNYQRLTGWKDSKDFDDYQERVANGWDVRAEGWLPAYPQLGMKLVYEQYYGNEVALFDKDDRQKDPHAVTVGVNYTPVPLLTLSAGQREGKADDSETRVGLQMNYQLGVPWMHQVDPDSVAALRTLTGSRYDLVDRNNNIILEYRKKEVIRLHSTDLITGNGGEQKSSGVAVNSKYGVKQVDWSAPALIAAGGKIVSNSPTNYDVVLPAWQSGNGAVNTYTVTGVAVDNKGNRSSESETQVTVNAAEIRVLYSTFTPESPLSSSTTDSDLPADGVSSEVMTLTLLDEQKQPVDVPLEDITLTTKFTTRSSSSSGLRAQPEVDATVSALTRKSSGVYEATVTAGTKVELVTITPSVRKTTLSAARVFIIKKAPNGGQSTFTASPKTVAADGIAASTLTLTAKDVAGNILPGIAGNLSVSVVDSHNGIPAADKITVSSMTETATPSIYTATIKSSLVDTLTIKPRFNGIQLGALSAAVEFVPGAFKNVTVKDYVFSNSAGFPTTTFNGANFTLGTPDGKNASDYTWTSSQTSWVSVNSSGVVTLTGKPTSATKSVTILATPKTTGLVLSYKFTVKYWFATGQWADLSYADSVTKCASQSGASIPPTEVLTSGNSSRAVGNLHGEWGDMITNWGWPTWWYFTSTPNGAGKTIVALSTGIIYGSPWTGTASQACAVSL